MEAKQMGHGETTNWETLSWWGKLTDKDPSRPKKNLSNIILWTTPINHYTDRVQTDSPRFSKGTFPLFDRDVPCLNIRTTQFKGDTYKNIRLSYRMKLVWVGWFWGWK